MSFLWSWRPLIGMFRIIVCVPRVRDAASPPLAALPFLTFFSPSGRRLNDLMLVSGRCPTSYPLFVLHGFCIFAGEGFIAFLFTLFSDTHPAVSSTITLRIIPLSLDFHLFFVLFSLLVFLLLSQDPIADFPSFPDRYSLPELQLARVVAIVACLRPLSTGATPLTPAPCRRFLPTFIHYQRRNLI